MRENKFRAWDKEHKFMFDVREITFENNKVLAWRKALPEEFSPEIGRLVGAEVELMQYTGFTDIKGKEICEGDILRSFTPNRENTGAIIDYDDEFIIVHDIRDIKEQLMFMLEPVVVGNIFETSELVKS